MDIGPLTHDDIPAALRLSTQAGWNQLDADWRRLFDLWPGLCLAGRVDGEVVATTTVARYGSVAWVGMVLVDEACRGKGYGGAIMDAAIALASEAGIETLGLDATDLGKPVYAKRGFDGLGGIDRRVLPAEKRLAMPSKARPMSDADWPGVLELDLASTGWDRAALLEHVRSEDGVEAVVVRDGLQVTAFGFRRSGRTAEHIGPVVGDGEAAMHVVRRLMGRNGDLPVMIDTFWGDPLAPWFDAQGFAVTRRLTRMWRGGELRCRNVAAAAGLELG